MKDKTEQEQQLYRFSESPIWDLQRAYYEEQGIRAWQNEEVPQYITSNPSVAMAYAEMIFGFLQDRARLGYIEETVTAVELGAGSGRLAFHILKELYELIESAGIGLPPFRYVMSDLAEGNVTFWQQHPSLIPYAKQGVLDFAKFDAVKDAELTLTRSGQVIRPGDLLQPIIVIANYLFDGIPQELIYIEEGKVFDCNVSLQYPDDPEGTTLLSPTDKLEKVVLEYHYQRATEYEQEAYMYHDVIKVYRDKLDDSHILFPERGIACLQRLGQLSQQGFLLLTADKGDHRLENWEYSNPPKLIVHGSFSLTANYHAIQAFFEGKGAESFFTTHHHNDLNVGCILMLKEPKNYAQTRLAYRRFVERFGPDDFFSMKQWFDGRIEEMELRQILALWRLGGYDSQWVLQTAKRIWELIPTCKEYEVEDVRRGIHLMWKTYYPLEERRNLALDCGLILYQMEFYEDALLFFERSMLHKRVDLKVDDEADSERDSKVDSKAECEIDFEVLYYMAVCCYETNKDDVALDYTRRTLALEPAHEGALALQALLVEII